MGGALLCNGLDVFALRAWFLGEIADFSRNTFQFERSFLEKSAEAIFTGKCIPVNLGFLEKSSEKGLIHR